MSVTDTLKFPINANVLFKLDFIQKNFMRMHSLLYSYVSLTDHYMCAPNLGIIHQSSLEIEDR